MEHSILGKKFELHLKVAQIYNSTRAWLPEVEGCIASKLMNSTDNTVLLATKYSVYSFGFNMNIESFSGF